MKNESKTWFITGASSGFGRELTEAALADGDRVIAAARRTETLVDLSARWPDRLKILKLDVTRGEEIRSAVKEASSFGPVDVLVNNAGYSLVGAVEETSEAELRGAMETMFFGAAALTQAFLPSMRERRSGHIVQITSMGGLTTAPGFSAYCAAKHALEGYSECLQREVAPYGVRVLIVEPGAFRTSLFGDAFRRMPAMAEYAATVGESRAFAKNVGGVQAGDPKKAARAIIESLSSKEPALRLPLGPDAVDGIRAKLAEIAKDVDRHETIARNAVFSS